MTATPGGTDAGRVLGEQSGVVCGLRAAMDDDGRTWCAARHELVRRVAALVDREEDPLARRAEREDAVEAGADIELDTAAIPSSSMVPPAPIRGVTAAASVPRGRSCLRARNPTHP